jgi:hypothetical protein
VQVVETISRNREVIENKAFLVPRKKLQKEIPVFAKFHFLFWKEIVRPEYETSRGSVSFHSFPLFKAQDAVTRVLAEVKIRKARIPGAYFPHSFFEQIQKPGRDLGRKIT